MISTEISHDVLYSKTCLKQLLMDIQNRGRTDKWTLTKGRKYCRMLPAFCNNFDLHYAIISLDKQRCVFFLSCCLKRYPFKNIFDFTLAGDWDCVMAVERRPALHYSVDFIFMSFGIMGFIVEPLNY